MYYKNKRLISHDIELLRNDGYLTDTITLINQGTDDESIGKEHDLHLQWINEKVALGWEHVGMIKQIGDRTYCQLLKKKKDA